mmetsp:Transcript_13472/g.31501  ORF Transcript_13472/g.31501 Transcript_13472/m.31501 type:complete len:203 (+) Transcript_13472:86-694(+)
MLMPYTPGIVAVASSVLRPLLVLLIRRELGLRLRELRVGLRATQSAILVVDILAVVLAGQGGFLFHGVVVVVVVVFVVVKLDVDPALSGPAGSENRQRALPLVPGGIRNGCHEPASGLRRTVYVRVHTDVHIDVHIDVDALLQVLGVQAGQDEFRKGQQGHGVVKVPVNGRRRGRRGRCGGQVGLAHGVVHHAVGQGVARRQ